MKKIIFISISCVLALLVIGGIVLVNINMIKKDFNKSDYKYIKIKSNWEKIYCDDNHSRIVCAKTKDGYMEIYDTNLNYLKKIKLPEYKKIKIDNKEIIILKQDGTVWYCNTEKDNQFIIIDYLTDVDDIYPSFFYWIYKDKKGDFYYIQNHNFNDINELEPSNNVNDFKKPQLIKNLKDAEILNFDTGLVYTKDGNTYVNFYYIYQEQLVLFDIDNNVTYDKCFEGVSYKCAFCEPKKIYLVDANKRITNARRPYKGKVQVTQALEKNINLDKIVYQDDYSQLYALDKKGNLYEVAVYSKDDETPEISNPKVHKDCLFKYKKFKNIYGGFYLYATDDKYLYKLNKD